MKFDTGALRFRSVLSHPLFAVFLCYFVISLVKSVVSLSVRFPQNFIDEMMYDQIAGLISSGQILLGLSAYPSDYPPIYPAVLSLAYLLPLDRIGIYHAELIVNCFISTLVLFPSFFILKRYCPEKTALVGSVLVSVLIVITGSSFLLVSENVFILLFVLSLYLFIRSFSPDSSPGWDYLLGLIFLLLVLTRQTGLAIFAAFCIVYLFYCLMNCQRVGVADLLKKGIRISLFFIFLLFAWVVDTLLHLNRLPHINNAVFLTDSLIHSILQFPVNLVYTTSLEIEYLLFSVLLLPFFFCLYAAYRLSGSKDESGFRVTILLYPLISSLFLFIMATLFIFGFISHESPITYGRYIDPIIPVITLGGVIGMNWYREKRDERGVPHLFLLYLLASVALFIAVHIDTLVEPNNNYGIAYLYKLIPDLFPYTVLIPVIIAGVSFLWLHHGRSLELLLTVLILITILFSVPVLFWEIRMSENYWQIGKFCQDLDRTFGMDVGYVWDETGNNGRYDAVYYDSMKFWFTDRLSTRQVETSMTNGTMYLSIPGITKNERWLVSRTDYPMVAKGKIEDFRVYSLNS